MMTFERIHKRLYRSKSGRFELRSHWLIEDGYVKDSDWFVWSRMRGAWECVGQANGVEEAKRIADRALWHGPRAQMRKAE